MTRPNIVFMISHDLGQHLHCYGARTVRSMHIDELAQRGVRFGHAFSTAPQCSPARAAISTGRYPHSNGVMGLAHERFAWFLPDNETHIASLLSNHGYETILVGTQHLAKLPTDLGFEQFIAGSHAKVAAPNAEVWLDTYATRADADADDNRPFYLEIGFEEAHRPYSQTGLNEPDTTLGTDAPRWLPSYDGSDDETAALQGDIYELDQGVGRILRKLEALGLDENTIVIFTADHGLDYPRAKGSLYDPGIEVPLIMYWSRVGSLSGHVVPCLVSHIDILPTLLDMIGINVPSNVQGRSFLSVLNGQAESIRDEIYAEKTYHTTYDPMRSIRTARHKLIMHFNTYDIVDVPIDAKSSPAYLAMMNTLIEPAPFCELYDLEEDALESNNLAEDPKYKDVLNSLIRSLHQWMIDTNDPLLKGPVPSPQYQRALEILRGSADA